jgi:hypothetical protein
VPARGTARVPPTKRVSLIRGVRRTRAGLRGSRDGVHRAIVLARDRSVGGVTWSSCPREKRRPSAPTPEDWLDVTYLLLRRVRSASMPPWFEGLSSMDRS